MKEKYAIPLRELPEDCVYCPASDSEYLTCKALRDEKTGRHPDIDYFSPDYRRRVDCPIVRYGEDVENEMLPAVSAAELFAYAERRKMDAIREAGRDD